MTPTNNPTPLVPVEIDKVDLKMLEDDKEYIVLDSALVYPHEVLFGREIKKTYSNFTHIYLEDILDYKSLYEEMKEKVENAVHIGHVHGRDFFQTNFRNMPNGIKDLATPVYASPVLKEEAKSVSDDQIKTIIDDYINSDEFTNGSNSFDLCVLKLRTLLSIENLSSAKTVADLDLKRLAIEYFNEKYNSKLGQITEDFVLDLIYGFATTIPSAISKEEDRWIDVKNLPENMPDIPKEEVKDLIYCDHCKTKSVYKHKGWGNADCFTCSNCNKTY